MSHKWNDERLTRAIMQSLDAVEHQLDANSLKQLQARRYQALQPPRRLSRLCPIPSYSWVTASAGLVTLSLILWGMPLSLTPNPTVVTPFISQTSSETKYHEPELNNMDVMMSNEELDFLENLDMYEWLATHV